MRRGSNRSHRQQLVLEAFTLGEHRGGSAQGDAGSIERPLGFLCINGKDGQGPDTG